MAPAGGRQYVWGTGRRKSAVARVRIADGKGQIKINGREVDDYFSEDQDRNAVVAPLELIDERSNYDVFVNVSGGGHTGQAGAVRMGLARALGKAVPEKMDAEAGHLTRDSRMVERKKYGRRGARRSFQFSKR
ncbi:MAG: 30S ribosomal protein S9 [Anaerolineaceae bacterium]|nr:30S ribosomal protein S9 [Anaerolineaceae bacterium]